MAVERLDEVDETHLDDLMALYRSAWWAKNREPEEVRRMLRHTDVKLGFRDTETGRLVAFTRVLTDYVYKAFLFDVIVAPEFRGAGLGRALVDAVLQHPELRGVQMVELYCKEGDGLLLRAVGLHAGIGGYAADAPPQRLEPVKSGMEYV